MHLPNPVGNETNISFPLRNANIVSCLSFRSGNPASLTTFAINSSVISAEQMCTDLFKYDVRHFADKEAAHAFRRLSLINTHRFLLKLLHHSQTVCAPDSFLVRVKKKESGYARLSRFEETTMSSNC